MSTPFTKHLVPITSIVVGDRQRVNLGDIDSLADSLDRYGLIQPIVLDDPATNNLIAGGRRLAAATSLEWTHVQVVYKGQLSESQRQEMELEENVRRKEMSWQERVIGIATIHNTRTLEGINDGYKWGYNETGELLGMTKSNVAYALWIAKGLKAGDKQLSECENLAEAIRVVLQRKEDEMLGQLKVTEAAAPISSLSAAPEVDSAPAEPGSHSGSPKVVETIRVYRQSALDYLSNCPEGSIDHIITDPPYGIDMDFLSQDNVGMNIERTRDEHDVEENKKLLHEFLPLAFHATKSNSFCVMWCDFAHWGWLTTRAEAIGWKVQRWPLVWVKTDSMLNMAAQFNFTKKTEIALVLRKPGAALAKTQPTNFWVGSGEDKLAFNHPFAKPLPLWQWIIEAVSYPDQTILDPFAGSGTCPAAAALCGRKPIACEIVEAHHSECVENVKKALRLFHADEITFSYGQSSTNS